MLNEENEYTLIQYQDDGFVLDVYLSKRKNTIWLTVKQISFLLEKDESTIRRQIKGMHILPVENIVDRQKLHIGERYPVTTLYSIDVIKRLKQKSNSNRVLSFINWANRLHNLNIDVAQETAKYKENSYNLVRFQDGDFILDVSVSPEEDTVLLSAFEMASMFERDYKTILKHIENALNEELDERVVVAKFATTTRHGAIEGKTQTHEITYYNLDMIISVGYRVKSMRGVRFRQWATSILRQYLLKGHIINEERCLACTSNIVSLNNKMELIESKINKMENTIYSSNTKVIYEGEILEGYAFFRKLFFLAKKEIIVTDYYADKTLLLLLKDLSVRITIVTSTSSYLNKEVIPINIALIYSDIIHGRYIFIDDMVYVSDTSFNDIGKKRFLVIKLEDITKDVILKNII